MDFVERARTKKMSVGNRKQHEEGSVSYRGVTLLKNSGMVKKRVLSGQKRNLQ